jgi:hypothetical protein
MNTSAIKTPIQVLIMFTDLFIRLFFNYTTNILKSFDIKKLFTTYFYKVMNVFAKIHRGDLFFEYNLRRPPYIPYLPLI